MRNKVLTEKQRKARRMYKLQTRMTVCFFGVIITFIICSALSIYVADKLGFSLKHLNNPMAGIFNICLLCIVLSTLASFFLVHKIFAPIEQISEASLKVAEGNFDVTLSYNGHLEELDNTIQNFNRMVKELGSVEIIRNDFIADVSHEFKTPLGAISGYATFLQDIELSQEERNEYIRKIFFNIDKLNDLTENILRLSKLEHQEYMQEPSLYRLDEQIREAIVYLEPKWSCKNINFDIKLTEMMYLGQQSLLFLVWTNIIGNAIKYSENDADIAVYLRHSKENVQVIVSDTGIGMSEETMLHIFDKFYQGDTSRKSQGNGLGLALCNEIVEKCGGKIFVESTLGVGSVFIVTLPISE